MSPSARIEIGKKEPISLRHSLEWGVTETVDELGHYHIYAAAWKNGKAQWTLHLLIGGIDS